LKNKSTLLIFAFIVIMAATVLIIVFQQTPSPLEKDGASIDDSISLSQKDFLEESDDTDFQEMTEPLAKSAPELSSDVSDDKSTEDKTSEDTKTYVLRGVVYETLSKNGIGFNRQNHPINEFTVEGVANWSYHSTEKNRFEIYRTLPKDSYLTDEFSFTVTSEDYASIYKWEGRLEEPETPVFVNLSKGGTLTGRLLYADGEPVEGAVVTVECHTCDEDAIVPGVSDQDGRFTVYNIPQVDHQTVFVSTAYFDHNISFPLTTFNKPAHDLGDIVLPKKGKLTVRIESNSTESVAGHKVKVQMNSSERGKKYYYFYREIPDRVTNANGIVEYSNIPYPSYCFVWLNNTLFQSYRTDSKDEEVVFNLHDTAIKGRVTMGGEIPDTFSVSLEGDNPNFRAAYVGSKIEPNLNSSTYDGTYELEGIPEGRYELEFNVLPKEYDNPSAKLIVKYDVQIEEGKTVVQNHDFKNSILRAKVTDSEGKPIEGAYVTTRAIDENDQFMGMELVSWKGAEFRSNSNGKLKLDKLFQAPYRVGAYYKNVKSNPVDTEPLLPGDQNSEITIKLPYDQESRIVIRLVDEETENLIEDIESISILFDTQIDGRVYVDEVARLEEPGTFEVRGIPKENNFTIEYDFKSGWVPAYYHESDFAGGLKPFQKPEDNEPLDFYLTKKSILDITHMGGGPNSFDNFAPVYELSRVRKDGSIEILEHVGKDRRYVNLEAGTYHLSVFNGDEEYHFQEVEIRSGEYKRINVGPPN